MTNKLNSWGAFCFMITIIILTWSIIPFKESTNLFDELFNVFFLILTGLGAIYISSIIILWGESLIKKEEINGRQRRKEN